MSGLRILLLAHRFPPLGTGGVETWAWDLSAALARAGHAVCVLARDERRGDGLPPFTLVDGAAGGGPPGVVVRWIRHAHADGRAAREAWNDRRFVAPLERAIRAFGPDLLHIAHPDGWGVVPVRVAERLALPVGATLHDYKWLCGRGQMIQADGTVCDGPLEEACTRCLADQLGAGPLRGLLRRVGGAPLGQLAHRRDLRPVMDRREPGARVRGRWHQRQRAMLGALRSATLITSPSQFVADVHRRAGLDRPIQVLRNGADRSVNRPNRAPGPLRIGFFGTAVPTKGLDLLLRAVRSMKPGSLELQVHGPVSGSDGGGIQFRGPYPHDAVGARMAEVDVVALPSSWHENAPMVAAEARAAGRLLLASDRGGLPELVRHGVDGWIEPADDAAAWRARLDTLAGDLDRVRAATARVEPPPSSDSVAAGFVEAWEAALDAQSASRGSPSATA